MRGVFIVNQDNIGKKRGKTGLKDSDEPLLMAAENLKEGMMFTMSQLNSRRVLPEKKLRWLKALTRQAEALVDVVEALNKIDSKSASDVDLASFLSSLETKIPAREARTLRRASLDFHRVVGRATGMRRLSCHDY